ncbi:MAG TPA: phosphomannomutase/phosphoglucomutase [Candidatus Limnocylindria bacterium]|jgi:phosphomannomutase|nr:phosphomannomutase/phosphoglucomutase [Candidatus Limnocylindria bacterium]
MPNAFDTSIFKSYDVRGIVGSQLTPEIAYLIGRAFVQTLGRTNICIGRDMRPSGTELLEALARGATDGGADVTRIGLISTDALYFAVGKYGFDGGMMITASHNPAEYNGLKFCRENAEALSLDTGLGAVRDLALSGNFTTPARKGTIKDLSILDDFGKHCVSFIRDVSKVKPFKIAIDAGNGMAGETVPYVFKYLPQVEVIPLYFELDGTFPNHPASPIEDENKLDLRKAVLEHGCDLGVAFDGDADRMFIVDEQGGFPDGSIVTAAVGVATLKVHPGSKILYNLICSRSVPEAILANGGVPVRSQVGHSLIKPLMKEQNIAFGGEHSGHFYFRDNWFADSGMIALMQCLDLFSEVDGPITKAIAPFNQRFRSGEINTKVADADAKMREIQAHFKGAKVDHLDGVSIEYPDWWLNVRKSNTEPLLRLNVEGDTRELMEKHRDEALQLIRS